GVLAAGLAHEQAGALDGASAAGGPDLEWRHGLRWVGSGECGPEPPRVGECKLVRLHEGGSRVCRAEIVACSSLDRDHPVDRPLGLSETCNGSDLRERRALAIAARRKAAVRASSAAGDECQRERGDPAAQPPQDGLSVTVPFHTSVSSQS
ncbi:MAG: hypothetical protein QOG29_1237, partial [Gaiellaceae bacterium]|nr:hypothetical protein [Gaiellaceae bacterium]